MVYNCSFCEEIFYNQIDFTNHGFETCINCGNLFKHYNTNPNFSKYNYFGYIRCFDNQDSNLLNDLFQRIPSLKEKHYRYFQKNLNIDDNIDCYKKIVDLYGYYEGYLLSKVLLPDGYICEACLKEFEWKKEIVHLVSALSKK